MIAALLSRIAIPAPVQAGWAVTKGIATRIPWQVWAALAVCVGLWAVHHHGYATGYAASESRYSVLMARQQADFAAALRQARATEHRQSAAFSATLAQLKQEQAHAQAESDRTVADLRAGRLRVRDHFTCPARVPETPTGAPGSDGAGEGGLSDADAEFLVRLAADADATAQRLTACQALLAADRK